MAKAQILIVDDDAVTVRLITGALHNLDCELSTTGCGANAIAITEREAFNLMLLDLVLEDMNGIDVLRETRLFRPDMSVIVLTGHGSMDSAIEALRLGAHDYLIKPFSPETLRKRVEEGLARHHTYQAGGKTGGMLRTGEYKPTAGEEAGQNRFLKRGALLLDQYQRRAQLTGRCLTLTTAEYDILWTLAKRAPDPVKPRELLIAALGYEASGKEAAEIIKWHIHQLRKKVEPDPQEPVLIKTIRYQGYAWVG